MQMYRKVLAKSGSQTGVNSWAQREGSNNNALLDFRGDELLTHWDHETYWVVSLNTQHEVEKRVVWFIFMDEITQK